MAEKKELTEEEQQAAINKVLGEPIFDGFTENVYRIRRNLLAFAILSLVVTLNDLTINETNLPVKGLSNQGMYTLLFIITLYHLAHFWSYVLEYYNQWRIRLTGRRLYVQTSKSGIFGPEPGREDSTNLHQSTLYSWWKFHKSDFNRLSKELFSSNDEQKSQVNELLKRLNDIKLETRLHRFDSKFWKFQRQQHLNWIIFEVSIPILAAIAALALLLSRFCGY